MADKKDSKQSICHEDYDFSPYDNQDDYERFERPTVRTAILRAQHSDYDPLGNRHKLDLYKDLFPEVPVIKNIHQALIEAYSSQATLEDYGWGCNTDRGICRACWIVALSGEKGIDLAKKIGAHATALAVYAKSDPYLEEAPLLHADDDTIYDDMQCCAINAKYQIISERVKEQQTIESSSKRKRKILTIDQSKVTYVRGPNDNAPHIHREKGTGKYILVIFQKIKKDKTFLTMRTIQS